MICRGTWPILGERFVINDSNSPHGVFIENVSWLRAFQGVSFICYRVQELIGLLWFFSACRLNALFMTDPWTEQISWDKLLNVFIFTKIGSSHISLGHMSTHSLYRSNDLFYTVVIQSLGYFTSSLQTLEFYISSMYQGTRKCHSKVSKMRAHTGIIKSKPIIQSVWTCVEPNCTY